MGKGMLLGGLFMVWAAGLAAASAAQKEPEAKLDGQAVMKKSDCFSCHQVKMKVVGPSYVDVAKKYKGRKDAVSFLVKKVKEGGSGNWGAVPMAAHPLLSEAELKAAVEWILKQKK